MGDNTNLDKARALLVPIKAKYGMGLSWGDLFVLAGTTALRSMGTPITTFCAGRVDEIRTTFNKMGHDDRATVALIGGGHAFGKAHGACPLSDAAGLPPNKAYASLPIQCPWSGRCGTGKGNDTWTSGFEGAWTSTPTKWSNEFFKYLVDKEWEKHVGPGGHYQWRMKDSPDDPRMRFTTDMALLQDAKYKAIVEEFASNMTALDEAFDSAWTALTENGNGWSTKKKCDSFSLPTYDEQSMLETDMEFGTSQGP